MPENASTDVEQWVEETSAFERVLSIVFDITDPRTAGHIAQRAQVSEETAREYLDGMVTLGAVLADDSGGATVYFPDPGYLRFREVRSMARDHGRSELVEMAASTADVIEQYRDRTGVETLDELEARINDGEFSEETTVDYKNVAADWLSTRQQLDRIEDAIDWYDVLAADIQSEG